MLNEYSHHEKKSIPRAILEIRDDKLLLLPIGDTEEEVSRAAREIWRLIQLGDLAYEAERAAR